MADALILRVFEWVIHNDMERHGVSIDDVIRGITHMTDVYKHNPLRLTTDNANAVDFRSTAFRCAYLHKYAPLHTMLVSDIFNGVVHQNHNYFRDIVWNSRPFKICSLGGGPGSDVIGMLLTLRMMFGDIWVSSILIDSMPVWRETLYSLMHEVHSGFHEALSFYLKLEYFRWNYIGANLLEEFSPEVEKAISFADIISMVKFVSAAICSDTEKMIKKIFSLLKPGAVVFFIDNSIGETKFIMRRVALEYNLKSLFGPIDHIRYSNSLVHNYKFRHFSCCHTNVAIKVWLKPFCH